MSYAGPKCSMFQVYYVKVNASMVVLAYFLFIECPEFHY